MDGEGGVGGYIIIPASFLSLIFPDRSQRRRFRKAVAGFATALLFGFGIGPRDSLLVGVPVSHIAIQLRCNAIAACILGRHK